MANTFKADDNVQMLAKIVKDNNHSPRLDEATVSVCFQDVKPFKNDRFNFGNVKKFPPLAKAFPGGEKCTFVLLVSASGYEMMSENQREAWIDLLLQRCGVAFIPEMDPVKKNKPAIDEFGRIKYTDTIKRDKDGDPIFKVNDLGIDTITANVKRYNLWMEDLTELGQVIETKFLAK